jgi:hypothetical protein
VIDQRGDVFGALAQRRQRERVDVDAVIEILAKGAAAHHLIEIAMGGDDDADVYRDGAVASDALDLLFLEHAQQLGLHDRGHIANFVEEQRAAMGLLELAEMARDGAGEGAFLVAEELGFDQLAGDGRAVQRDKWTVAARAAVVQRAGDQFFAGAGFAQDGDAGFAGSHAIDLRHHAAHTLSRVHDLMASYALAKLPILLFEALQAHHIIDCEEQLFGGERLLEKVDGSQSRGAHGHLDVGLA